MLATCQRHLKLDFEAICRMEHKLRPLRGLAVASSGPQRARESVFYPAAQAQVTYVFGLEPRAPETHRFFSHPRPS